MIIRNKQPVHTNHKQFITTDPLSARVHARLLIFPWIKPWYLFRAIDSLGSGLVNLSHKSVLKKLNCADSTLYKWLKIARDNGAIHEFVKSGDRLRVRLGSLFNVCQSLGLDSWGASAQVNLDEVLSDPAAIATEITAQQLQEQSHYAARHSLSKRENKSFKIRTANEILERVTTASHKPNRGATKIPFLVHIGPKRAFVSGGFVPFGISQDTIAAELGVSDRTVRRHLAKVTRRQICQSKDDYREVQAAARYGGEFISESGIRVQVHEDHLIIRERNGFSQNSRSGGTKIPLSGDGKYCDRLFNYFGKTWMYKCNIYALDRHLNKMRFTRAAYKKRRKSIDKSSLSPTTGVAEHPLHKLS